MLFCWCVFCIYCFDSCEIVNTKCACGQTLVSLGQR